MAELALEGRDEKREGDGGRGGVLTYSVRQEESDDSRETERTDGLQDAEHSSLLNQVFFQGGREWRLPVVGCGGWYWICCCCCW